MARMTAESGSCAIFAQANRPTPTGGEAPLGAYRVVDASTALTITGKDFRLL